MSNEVVLKRCNKCGKVVKVMKDSACPTMCCGEEMVEVIPNSVDAAVEKHVPQFEVREDRVYVQVNHVMEDDHYIEWISVVSEERECIRYFKPGENAETHFKYIPGSTLYAYCNKHGLWKADVK